MTITRQVVLDTETTGLEWTQDHRIIEIGCVELINRRFTGRHFHRYINPQREIDAGAMEVHGITQEYLEDKPTFDIIASEFLEFVSGAELVIHNAVFDLGFLNHELRRMNLGDNLLDDPSRVVDTLLMARQLHPGQRNNLDALCKRYGVDNSQRTLHGALLDAEILADVYLLMTGGQTDLGLGGEQSATQMNGDSDIKIKRLVAKRNALKVVYADETELELHDKTITSIASKSGQPDLW
ncbi:MAG: DNA polymerase III subunit epsilon [Porticoccaceae bacterium]|nr:DNA polymerase III subunit epsilon [Porticoccaceae bacterium]